VVSLTTRTRTGTDTGYATMKMISGRLAARLRSALGRRRPAIYGVTGTLVGLTFAGVVATRSWIALVALIVTAYRRRRRPGTC